MFFSRKKQPAATAPKKSFAASARLSKGPLYSARELKKVEADLVARGFRHAQDDSALGLRIYNRTDGACATLYLDDCGCDPNNSGIMFVTRPSKPAQALSVWTYLKETRDTEKQEYTQDFTPKPPAAPAPVQVAAPPRAQAGEAARVVAPRLRAKR